MIRIKTGYTFGEGAKHAWMFMVAGLLTITSPWHVGVYTSLITVLIAGLVLMVFGLVLHFSAKWILFDTNNGLYCEVSAIVGFGKKEWLVTPRLSSLVLTSANVKFWTTPNGVSPSFKSNMTVYTMGFFSDHDQPDIVVQMTNKAYAQRMSRKLADHLQIQLVQQL